MAKVNLFCFPYAGGSATIYARWKRYLHPLIELCPVEMTGRGSRFHEPLKFTMEDVIEDLYHLIRQDLDTAQYMFFGHSFGTAVICELMDKIYDNGHQKPLHIFVSGRYPPHFPIGTAISHLPDEEFIHEVFKLGGTPQELLDNKELLDMFIPVLRADYRAIEPYCYQRRDYRWDVNISVLNGTRDDELKDGEIAEWKEYTNRNCTLYSFEGGHFFIHEHMSDIALLINNTLKLYL